MTHKKENNLWRNPVTIRTANTGMSDNVIDNIKLPYPSTNEEKGTFVKDYILNNLTLSKEFSFKGAYDKTFNARYYNCLFNLEKFGCGCLNTLREIAELLLRNPEVSLTYDYGEWLVKNEDYKAGNEYKIRY